jgi:aminoglycoside phosphotransferase (APT) family kinase protein
MTFDPTTLTPVERKVHAWLIANLGPVLSFERQLRWRLGWDVVVNRNGEDLPLYVRAPKGETYFSPVDMYQEAEIHRAFEANGIPAPRVFGMIEDPVCIVMEKLPGEINTGLIEDPAARQKVRDEFIDIVARVHQIPISAFAAAKLPVPKTPAEIALNLYGPAEDIFRQNVDRPWPIMDFVALWLKRNVPQDRTRVAFVNYDAGQFLYDGDRVSGLIDFEVSSFGDPAAELSGMRLRDSSEPLGDLNAAIDRYEKLTGDKISKKLIEYHTAGFCGVNGFLLWPLAFNSTLEQDYTAYMNFSVGTGFWIFKAMAEYAGISLIDPRDPVSRPLGFPRASAHLIDQINAFPGGTPQADYARDSAAALARYLSRWNEFGLDIRDQDLADASALVGKELKDWDEAQAAVKSFVESAPPSEDARLIQHFHNWLRRQAFILKGCGPSSYIIETPLQVIRPR